MPQLNRLNAVAHNLGHWFGSTMNLWGGLHAYGIDFLAGEADSFPDRKIQVDVLRQISVPPLDREANRVIEPLRGRLAELLAKEGLDLSTLAAATMEFDFSAPRPRQYAGQPVYDCRVTLVSRTGKTFTALVTERS